VQAYWQRRMSKGVTPPPVKASDDDVVRFVGSTPAAERGARLQLAWIGVARWAGAGKFD
jgi:hypothetical protein